MKKTRASWDCLYCIAATNSQSIQGTEKEKLFELPPFLIPNKELQEWEIQMKMKKEHITFKLNWEKGISKQYFLGKSGIIKLHLFHRSSSIVKFVRNK